MSRTMWTNSLEASAIARSPCCLVVSPSLVLGEKHEARGGLVVKDQATHQLGSRSVQYVCQSGSTNRITHCRSRTRSPRRCPSQPT